MRRRLGDYGGNSGGHSPAFFPESRSGGNSVRGERGRLIGCFCGVMVQALFAGLCVPKPFRFQMQGCLRPDMSAAGFAVTFVPFDGGHAIPAEVVAAMGEFFSHSGASGIAQSLMAWAPIAGCNARCDDNLILENIFCGMRRFSIQCSPGDIGQADSSGRSAPTPISEQIDGYLREGVYARQNWF